MAGKKMRANKNRIAGFAASAARRPANKKRQQQTHVNHVAAQKIKTAETKELFNQVCEKYQLDSKGKYALKRLIGTVNSSRLTALLNKKVTVEEVNQAFIDAAKNPLYSRIKLYNFFKCSLVMSPSPLPEKYSGREVKPTLCKSSPIDFSTFQSL